MPIKQFYIKEKSFFEKCIVLSKNKRKIEFSYIKAKKKLIKNIKNLKLIANGNIIEYPIEAIQYLKTIKKKINKHNGGLLSFDYGYTKLKNINTLQSVKKHKFFNILSKPGSADITSHINYKLFTELLKNENLEVERIVTQNEFLKKIGIIDRANMLSKDMTFKEKADLFYRLKKLLDYQEMGKIFKVLFVRKKLINFSLGFK
jgi:cyclopropane-fatty-acyl-phospholipid synthase